MITKEGKANGRRLIFKIAAIGILVAVLNQVLSRAGRDEQAMMTTLAGLVVVLMDGGAGDRRSVCPGQNSVSAMIEVMIKVAAGAVTAAVCAQWYAGARLNWVSCWRWRQEFGCWWTVADSLKLVTDWMKWLCELAGLEDWLIEPVFKTVVLSILTRLTAEVCKSAGESGVAAFVETAGTILALAVSLPLVGGVLKMMEGMLM